MPVTDVQQDLDNLTLTITADFAAPVAAHLAGLRRPASAGEGLGAADLPGDRGRPRPHARRPHDVFMTGPDGDKHAGYWAITAVDEPTGFSFDDGFADLDFNPNPELPVSRNVYTFAEHDGGTRATYVSTFESAEALQKVLDMGVVEGTSSAINQIDDLVAS